MTPADVLEAAADILFVHGRLQSEVGRAGGPMCVEGAICYAQGRDPMMWNEINECPAIEALRRYLCREPWCWNDDIDDDSEIINTLKSCAKALREVES